MDEPFLSRLAKRVGSAALYSLGIEEPWTPASTPNSVTGRLLSPKSPIGAFMKSPQTEYVQKARNLALNIGAHVIVFLLCLSYGYLPSAIALFLNMDSSWYHSLHRPPLTPPGWIFGPMWTLLYALYSTTLYRSLVEAFNKRRGYMLPLLTILFTYTHVFNMIWTPLYFGFKRLDLAFFDNVLLVFMNYLCYATAGMVWKPSLVLYLPMVLWVMFACYLSASFYLLNGPSP
ncbi:Mitochondrial outer membrane transporter [Carpediemonas membranifera]|uniref:Mitochondrial outer membrane transporter n=1 Tax=Carpediemonas membranifera TaxID=201153 RepID=A0A8J6E9L2_9EUKA|nr:Mitochondrial outer membrane transporter [Carpediemonas membranifera]|eukprot:KAG9393505.1 Mitochondrial outer membrane transporter [Carpediemonas membranifera]